MQENWNLYLTLQQKGIFLYGSIRGARLTMLIMLQNSSQSLIPGGRSGGPMKQVLQWHTLFLQVFLIHGLN